MDFFRNIGISTFVLVILFCQLQNIASTNSSESTNINLILKNRHGDNKAIDVQRKRIVQALMHSTLPTASMIFFMTPAPLGPILGIVFAVFYAGFVVHEASQSTKESSMAMEFIMKMRKIEERVAVDSRNVIYELTFVITGVNMFSTMRRTLGRLESAYNKNLECLLDTNCLNESREAIIRRMLDPMDEYNQDLLNFNMNYMTTRKNDLKGLYPEISFYEHILQRNRKKASDNLDCNKQSDQTNIIKAYFYITEVLTNSYAMVVAAYMARYQQKLKSNETEEAMKYLDSAKGVVKEHLSTISVIIADTQWAINETSRDIRICDSSTPERGVTYDRLTNFIKARLVIIEDQDPQRNYHFWTDKSKRQCNLSDLNEASLNPNGFEFLDCTELVEDVYHVYTNPDDKERFYSFFTRALSNPFSGRYGEVLEIFGNPGEINSYYIPLSMLQTCSVSVCYAYRKRQMKFSATPIEAPNGYVVTGIRWKIINQTIYMEIQVGEFIDVTRVDPETVHWQNISTYDDDDDENFIFLNETQRSLILDDSILPSRSYVTGVQFIVIEGMLTLKVHGLIGNDKGTELSNQIIYSQESDVSKMVEWKLNDEDIPERAPKKKMNVVVGKPGQHFVKFQSSGLREDAGQTTIPYLDIQAIVTEPSAPIGGIGIYYKRIENYGGFVGLKMLSADLSDMVNINGFENFSKTIFDAFNKTVPDTIET